MIDSYAQYRDTDVPFLGRLPSHWTDQPAVTLARVLTSTVDKLAVDGETPVRLCNYTDVYYQDQIVDSGTFMEATATREQIAAYSVQAGDVVFTKDSETADDIGISAYVPTNLPGVVYGYHLSTYRPNDKRYGKFLKWLLDSAYVKATLRTRTLGVTRVGLSQNTVRYLRVPTPPPAEAEAIADFLDRETAEIDAFIADQEVLIRLLTERRAATITHAVTKGLDPSAPMGNSGIAWIGAVPDHWGITKLAAVFRTIGSGTTPPRDSERYFGGDVPWVTTSELRETQILETREHVTTEAVARLSALRLYPPGTILIAMYGATVGRLGVLGIAATTNQACCALAGPVNADALYIYYAMQAAKPHLLALADGGGQPNINQDKLRQLRVPCPPVREQREIVVHLDRETAELDAAIADAREAIALSKERRAALISAAVTGKIDVRGAV